MKICFLRLGVWSCFSGAWMRETMSLKLETMEIWLSCFPLNWFLPKRVEELHLEWLLRTGVRTMDQFSLFSLIKMSMLMSYF